MPTIFPTDVAELYRQQYELINQYGLINLAMPMFVFISGFLFGRQLKRKPLNKLYHAKQFLLLGCNNEQLVVGTVLPLDLLAFVVSPYVILVFYCYIFDTSVYNEQQSMGCYFNPFSAVCYFTGRKSCSDDNRCA